MAKVEPHASPLPPIPETDPLSEAQWKSLLALADAIIPSIQPSSTKASLRYLRVPDDKYSTILNSLEESTLDETNQGLARRYLAERPSQLPSFKDCFHRLLALNVPWDVKLQISLALTALK